MYSRVSLCPELRSHEKCFRVQHYDQGVFVEDFHQHIAKRTINADEGAEAIRALVVRFAGLSGQAILQAFLNKRAKNAPASSGLRVHVEHPEQGVVRKVCGANVIAWVDEVVNKGSFRQERTSQKEKG